MCNLCSVTTNKEAIRALAAAMGEWYDTTGNFQPLPTVFPDKLAPVLRHAPDGGREMLMMRWDCPPRPPMPGQKQYTRPITNIRNTLNESTDARSVDERAYRGSDFVAATAANDAVRVVLVDSKEDWPPIPI